MRLDQACTEFLSGYFSTHDRRKKTEDAYQVDLSQFCIFAGATLDLGSLGAAVVEAWAAHLRQKNYSPASIRRKMVALRVFTSYWVRRGTLPESPFWRVKLSYGHIEQLPRSLSEREMQALLTRAWRNLAGVKPSLLGSGNPVTGRPSLEYRVLRNLAIVDLLFATGMRVGEVSALDIRDFFSKEATFRVQGKGGRDRLAIIVDNATVRIQRSHLEARLKIKTKSSALFVNVDGGRRWEEHTTE